MSDLSKQLMLWNTLTDIEKQTLAQQQQALIEGLVGALKHHKDVVGILPASSVKALQSAKEAGYG